MAKTPKPCEWLTLDEALKRFVLAADGTQGSTHILPMHWHVASRLVVEGGFNPDHITPRPPFVITRKGSRLFLHHDAASGRGGEATVLGGLKTKDIDVVVDVPGIGPTVAVSIKGALNAFRNLTNRLEEAIGDCTNIHLGYPALVYGFLIAIRANREGEIPAVLQGRLGQDPKTGLVKASDVAMRSNGEVSEFIGAFHEAMVRLTGRRDSRDDVSRYEAISMMLASSEEATLGHLVPTFPAPDGLLNVAKFFDVLYHAYDLRYVYAAKLLQSRTRRLVWDPESPAAWDARSQGMTPRIGDDTATPVPSFETPHAETEAEADTDTNQHSTLFGPRDDSDA